MNLGFDLVSVLVIWAALSPFALVLAVALIRRRNRRWARFVVAAGLLKDGER